MISDNREHASSQEHNISKANSLSLEELCRRHNERSEHEALGVIMEELCRRHNERSEHEALGKKGIKKDRATFNENFNLTSRGTYIEH